MFQRKPRRFRRNSNGRNQLPRGVGNNSTGRGPNSFSNGHNRNKFRQSLSAEKSFEKYTSLAKEALSSGDKTLSENYFQHADHFMRIIEDKNKNRNLNKINVVDKPIVEEKKLSVSNDISSNQEININQEQEIKNKD